MSPSPLHFLKLKGVALSVKDLARASAFYGDTLALAPIQDSSGEVRFALGQSILMLKPEFYAPPTDQPNPRITVEVEDAPSTEAALLARGVVLSDPVQQYGTSFIGSFLDSEGNKLWFCSAAKTPGD